MLKLLVFAPSERVIVGEDKLTSVIVLLEAINVEPPGELPIDAIFPMDWNILILWHRMEEVSEAIKYEERIDIIRPDGEKVGGATLEFMVTNEFNNFRSVVKMDKFPIGIDGRCLIKLFLRKAGETNEWLEMAEYPIVVKHVKKENSNEASENTEA
jgi:hypothetical protein